jgi:hypothetical protein
VPVISFPRWSEVAPVMLRPHVRYRIRVGSAARFTSFVISARRLTLGKRNCEAIHAYSQRGQAGCKYAIFAINWPQWKLHGWQGRRRAPDGEPHGELAAAGSAS